jgi:excisionase family DNA binding protein
LGPQKAVFRGDPRDERDDMTDQDQLLCMKDVAQILGVSEQLVKRLVRKGKLVSVRVGEKLIRFRRQDLQAYIQQQRAVAAQALTEKSNPPARRTGKNREA